MSWIKMAVAGIALCATASVASAQAPAGTPQKMGQPGMRGQRGQAMLLNGITLTASQQVAVDSIRAKYRAQRGAMTRGSGRPDEAGRTKMMQVMEKQNAELRAILTADQQKVFDANVAEMKTRREKRRATQPRA